MSSADDDLYKRMFERAVEGMYRTALSGDYLVANPALARMHGCATPEEFIATFGRDRPVYRFPEDRQEFLRQIREKGAIRGFECRVVRVDGSTFWMSESARALTDENGELIGMEGFVEDITTRREMEDALREAKRSAEAASRAKSDFLANVGHELRTPMNAIIGFSELIHRIRSEVDEADESAAYAIEINDSARKLLDVLNDLLDFSRLDAESVKLVEDEIDIFAILMTVERRYADRLKDAELEVDHQLCAQTPSLRGDEKAVRRILANILSNAIKFTPPGGRITLKVAVEDDGKLLISISDTGIGMAAEDIPVALSPFSQVDNDRSRQFEGVGLGLPLARSLTELHGGELTIDSCPGEGTRVDLRFPAAIVRVLP